MSEHPLDELSALLDGELPPGEESAVRHHLAGCATCQAELSSISHARAALRSLLPVEPPHDLADRFLRRLKRVLAIVAGGAAGVAAGAAGMMWATAPNREVTPSVDLISQTQPDRAETPIAPRAMPAGYVAPAWLGSLRRTGLYEMNGVLLARYSDGVHRVALDEQKGELDTSGMTARAPSGALASAAQTPAAQVPAAYWWDGGNALTWQAGPAVLTLVGDPTSVAAAASALPAPRPSETLGGRLRRVCRELIEDLSGSQ
ncbi:MAG TPA: zf-HC2 domain-containing protein [Acidimicrobiales bacterium]|nr:zf-HC2 domain-containing protein [Acidimicrobiales bacterium]